MLAEHNDVCEFLLSHFCNPKHKYSWTWSECGKPKTNCSFHCFQLCSDQLVCNAIAAAGSQVIKCLVEGFIKWSFRFSIIVCRDKTWFFHYLTSLKFSENCFYQILFSSEKISKLFALTGSFPRLSIAMTMNFSLYLPGSFQRVYLYKFL